MARKSNKFKEKIQLRFNIPQMEKIIVALINHPLNKRFPGNVDKLFSSFIPGSYTDDYEKEYRVFLIKRLAETIIKNNISKKEDLLDFINFDGKYENDCVNLLNGLFENEMSEVELALIDKQVSQQLKYGIIGSNAEKIGDLITTFQTEGYEDLDTFMQEFGENLGELDKQLRTATESFENAKTDVSLGESNFIDSLASIIHEKKNPSNKIRTGLKAMNEILNGGYERSRLYVVLGLPKGFKSGYLLNSALWAIKHNDLKPQDPTKKPVVVYLTQENTVTETIERIWAHCFGNNSNISDYEPAVAARMLESAGIFTPNDPSKPELLIWYRANNSVTTADIQSLLEDLNKQGKECVFLVQDYIKRIRPMTSNKERRFELCNITDELSTIAKELNIPILTAQQLNREAMREFETGTDIASQVSAVEKMGSSNVSESVDVIQNCDYAFILGRATDAHMSLDGQSVESLDRYLVVKLVACRSKQPKFISFQHRFKEENDMALIEDVNLNYSVSVKNVEGLVKQKIADGNGTVKGKRKAI